MISVGYLKQEVKNLVKRHMPRSVRHAGVYQALKTDGIFVIPGFFSPERCELFRHELDRLLVTYESQLWKDAIGSDRRVFGADRVSALFSEYFNDHFIREALGEFENTSSIQGFTMAARLDFKPGNRGSGNGWHRDSAQYSQAKSIIYLSDASPENGPFEYVLGSQTSSAFVKGLMKGFYHHNQYRYTEEEIEKYLAHFKDQKAKTFPAPAGTLILADTRGLHRGSPIQTGSRYAATNYFFANMAPPEHLMQTLVKPVK